MINAARHAKRRHRREKIFKAFGLASIIFAMTALIVLFSTIISTGIHGFRQTVVQVPVYFDPAMLPASHNPTAAQQVNARQLAVLGLQQLLPDIQGRRALLAASRLFSLGAEDTIRKAYAKNPQIAGTTQTLWLLASTDVDQYIKGNLSDDPEVLRYSLTTQQRQWIEQLQALNAVQTPFSTLFFRNGDSREPELAGIRGALVGSAITLGITLLLAFPIGVLAAIYLEEFAPRNRATEIIEININNLAAVPSIVFGLLGLAVFLGFFGLPRSAPLVGGLVLALMTLPTIIIATRAALKAVPDSIRQAALGLGATPMQTVFHHVVPNALPGIFTGTIIGMAQALGETAPLLMIGMVAFIADVPQSMTDPATVLPVQVFIWSDSAERGFTEKTSAAIIVLLGFLLIMNALAVYLRRKFEKTW